MNAFGFAPKGWALCDGQLLPINFNQALFSVIETRFGGDGKRTFALPDLRGRVPMHRSADFPFAAAGGEESHSLTTAEIAPHAHALMAAAAPATTSNPEGAALATASPALGDVYGRTQVRRALLPLVAPDSVNPSADTSLQNLKTPMAAAVAPAGGGAPHDNVQPFLTLTFMICIAPTTFPSRPTATNAENGR